MYFQWVSLVICLFFTLNTKIWFKWFSVFYKQSLYLLWVSQKMFNSQKISFNANHALPPLPWKHNIYQRNAVRNLMSFKGLACGNVVAQTIFTFRLEHSHFPPFFAKPQFSPSHLSSHFLRLFCWSTRGKEEHILV